MSGTQIHTGVDFGQTAGKQCGHLAMRAPGSRGSVHEVYDSKRPRSVDLGFCPIKTLGFRRRGLFGSRQSTLISQAIPRQTPGFLALLFGVGL